MKKKVVSILLCAAMASTMLAGCGDKGSDNADANNNANAGADNAGDADADADNAGGKRRDGFLKSMGGRGRPEPD